LSGIAKIAIFLIRPSLQRGKERGRDVRASRALRLDAAGRGVPWCDEESRRLVRLENVAMRYGAGAEVLRDIAMRLDPGSFHYLTGPSGAGKTSLLRLLYLAERPSRGAVYLFDQDVAALTRESLALMRRKIGIVFQDFRLIDHLSAFDNVALPLRVGRVDEARIKAHVSELLDWVGLADQMAARPATLSGGQKQRIAIARAVIAGPSLLLADEPTGNVDDAMADRLMRLFEEMNRLGTTLVLATHNEALVARRPHPRLYLDNGRLWREAARARRAP
jgi:cell division transport system ATP-binding protein